MSEINEREKLRIDKYKARGFELTDRPCPATHYPDTRDRLEEVNMVAHDLIAYDDVDVKTYLGASLWHFLIVVGEQTYAFHRKVLSEYMESRRSHHTILGDMYDTPPKQTICSSSLMTMSWSDYSIVKLVPGYDVTLSDGTVKNLFECHFYTLARWLDCDEPDVVYCIPSITALREIEQGCSFDPPIPEYQDLDPYGYY
jgi:hypothetical protein